MITRRQFVLSLDLRWPEYRNSAVLTAKLIWWKSIERALKVRKLTLNSIRSAMGNQ